MAAMRGLVALGLCALTGGCASVDFDAAPAGAFKGELLVMWVGEGSGSEGDGRFVFVPHPDDPLTFTRSDDRVIRPGMMYTDGGSIPRAAQAFNGLSPWGYAPAYMIHDWLFHARHCLNDGAATPDQSGLADLSFEESARILAEAIQTLVKARKVERRDVAAGAISWAVASPVARSRWGVKGACAGEVVSAADRAAALRAIGRADAQISARTTRSAAPPPGPASEAVVARIRF